MVTSPNGHVVDSVTSPNRDVGERAIAARCFLTSTPAGAGAGVSRPPLIMSSTLGACKVLPCGVTPSPRAQPLSPWSVVARVAMLGAPATKRCVQCFNNLRFHEQTWLMQGCVTDTWQLCGSGLVGRRCWQFR